MELTNNMKKKQRGFTLIEMLVTITLLGILMTITTEMFVRVLSVANRAKLQSEIKNNAEASIAQFERIIRNAYRVEGVRTLSTYGGIWPPVITTVNANTLANCNSTASAGCEIILQNAVDSVNRYTRINFYRGNNTNNGTIRVASSTSETATDVLTAPETIITNANNRSGVNLTAYTIDTFIPTDNPAMIRISFELAQPVGTGRRTNELETNNYTTVLTLRNY